MSSHLRSTKFEITHIEYCAIAYSECLIPSVQIHSFKAGQAFLFDVAVDYSNPNYSQLPDALASGPCQVHVVLNKRYSPRASFAACCYYECSLLPFDDAVVQLPRGSRSQLVIYWDGRTKSCTAKRSREFGSLFDAECWGKSRRSEADL
ncbi:p17 nucleocytoplasmic shuttling suppressor protein [Chatham orthoreovirus]|nr:p17 nucleocytoplasmic shuttling suppressor protein [Chatham orthoreovirus]